MRLSHSCACCECRCTPARVFRSLIEKIDLPRMLLCGEIYHQRAFLAMIMLETHLFRNLEQTSVCIHSANMKFHTTNSHLQSINAITITQTKKRHNFRCFPFYILNFIVIIIIIARASYSNELPCHLQHTLETRQRHTLYRLLHHATERAERNSTVLCAAAVC